MVICPLNLEYVYQKIHWCLLPVNFQPGSNTLQHHETQAIHQIGKFICNVTMPLSFTGFRCWHMYDLWFRFNARPASYKFLMTWFLTSFTSFPGTWSHLLHTNKAHLDGNSPCLSREMFLTSSNNFSSCNCKSNNDTLISFVEGLNVINHPKCNKLLNVIKSLM